jgi:hypothetical protein
MTRYKKVAVTVPTATYAALERARAKLGRSRSEVIASAVEQWLQGLAAAEAERRYVEGYRRQPERPVGEALVRAATAGWSDWAPGKASRAAESRRAKR